MGRGVGNDPDEALYIPASLQRKAKEPKRQIQFTVPLSWWEELTDLSREFDQDITTFLREATQEWLQRARKIRQQAQSNGITFGEGKAPIWVNSS